MDFEDWNKIGIRLAGPSLHTFCQQAELDSGLSNSMRVNGERGCNFSNWSLDGANIRKLSAPTAVASNYILSVVEDYKWLPHPAK